MSALPPSHTRARNARGLGLALAADLPGLEHLLQAAHGVRRAARRRARAFRLGGGGGAAGAAARREEEEEEAQARGRAAGGGGLIDRVIFYCQLG